MDEVEGDVCEPCRHVLADGECPQCGWVRPLLQGPIPDRTDGPSGIHGW